MEGKVIVEIKALINLEDVHPVGYSAFKMFKQSNNLLSNGVNLAQAKNYVVAYDFSIGLLINFGATSLQFKKVFNPKYNNNPANPKIN